MVPSRRGVLQALGASGLGLLAGCSSAEVFGASEPPTVYTLYVDPVDVSPVDDVLYEPADRPLFGDPARAALDAILPGGRHTTYGYSPLPDDAYVLRDGTYYQLETTVTGRKRLPRTVVTLDTVEEDAVPDGALLVDDLARPAARVVKILHSHAQGGGASDLLRDGRYVLRRPAELESRLADDSLDGRVVTMTESGAWAYRIRRTREPIREPAHTALAFEIADTRAAFREVVFAAHVDTEFTGTTLPEGQRRMLDRAIDTERYTESAPPSAAFGRLLDRLGVGDRDSVVDGLRLWYDDAYYRYGLYVDESG